MYSICCKNSIHECFFYGLLWYGNINPSNRLTAREVVRSIWNIHHSTGIFWLHIFCNFGPFWLTAQQLSIMTVSPLCHLVATSINYHNATWQKNHSMQNGWPFPNFKFLGWGKVLFFPAAIICFCLEQFKFCRVQEELLVTQAKLSTCILQLCPTLKSKAASKVVSKIESSCFR